MEHRNEVVKKPSTKEIFFQNHLVEYEQPHIYSLEEEFAKTKKNHDFKPYTIFFSFVFLLLVITAVVGSYLEAKSREVSIGISDFEDLRLKETLHTAKEKEKELNRKTQELQQLNSSFEVRVRNIREKIQQEADLKNADKKALKRLEEKGKSQLDIIRKDYEKQIAKKQAEVNSLQEQIKYVASYQYGLSFFLREQRAAGCVIDPRQRKNVRLYFSKNPKLSTETIVELYRVKDQYIGKLKLVPVGVGFRAEVVEVAKSQSIKPLDWFQLR